MMTQIGLSSQVVLLEGILMEKKKKKSNRERNNSRKSKIVNERFIIISLFG